MVNIDPFTFNKIIVFALISVEPQLIVYEKNSFDVMHIGCLLLQFLLHQQNSVLCSHANFCCRLRLFNFRDLSYNDLSGDLPTFLDNLSALTYLQVFKLIFIFFNVNNDTKNSVIILWNFQRHHRKQQYFSDPSSWSSEKKTRWDSNVQVCFIVFSHAILFHLFALPYN